MMLNTQVKIFIILQKCEKVKYFSNQYQKLSFKIKVNIKDKEYKVEEYKSIYEYDLSVLKFIDKSIEFTFKFSYNKQKYYFDGCRVLPYKHF